MKEGFRQCMAWLHTWSGLVVGWVLFFVFITGTAGYVRTELNRWMEPERPLVNNQIPPVSQQFDKAYNWLQHNPETQQAQRWIVYPMTGERDGDELRVGWQEPAKEDGKRGKFNREQLDPVTGQMLASDIKPRDTGGGDALYAMHYQLHYIPYDWAIRIVGICTMLMFVAIISGVITHKKIFKDFFTFRPAKGQRSWLDSHNVLSVIALPFHIMITYSGLLFFLNAYMPLGVPMVYGFGKDNEERYSSALYEREAQNNDSSKQIPLGQVSAQFVNISALVQKMEGTWGKNKVRMVSIYPPGESQPARVEIYQAGTDGLSRNGASKTFDLNSGAEIIKDNANREAVPMKFSSAMFALHEGRFADALLRWVYVITGLVGAAMIATGLVLWTVKRRIKFSKGAEPGFGHKLVECLNIATVAGLPLAVAAYFWANRLLPVSMPERAAWEMHTLFMLWLAMFVYALCRPLLKAWREILLLASLSYMLLPVVNVLTTDKHLWATVRYGDWVLASVDLSFIAIGLLLGWASYKVHLKTVAAQQLKQNSSKASSRLKPAMPATLADTAEAD